MTNDKVDQTDNVAGGDIAGRDIKKTTVLHQEQMPPLRELAQKLFDRLEKDSETKRFLEDLSFYLTPRDRRDTLGLEQKLSEAGHDSLFDEGRILKEQFSKKVTQFTFYPAAQEYFAQCLARARQQYLRHIVPFMGTGEPFDSSDLQNRIYDHVVQPLFQEVGVSPLNLTVEHVWGMVYMLIGHCHLSVKA